MGNNVCVNEVHVHTYIQCTVTPHAVQRTYAFMYRFHIITWFINSVGRIFAKSEKSMMVICLAISSGSKSKRDNMVPVFRGYFTGGVGSEKVLQDFFLMSPFGDKR